jgi:hypothetical protein
MSRRVEPTIDRWQGLVLLAICVLSYLFWLLHSFAVRGFLGSVERLATKFLT